MGLADCPSHFPSLRESLPIPIHKNIQHVQLSTDKLDAIQGAIECNLVYNTLYHLTLRGWPSCPKQVLRISQHLWGTQNKLSIKASILLKANEVCIPPELLDCTLAHLNSAQQGMEKMQAQAREAVYSPSINADIIDYVTQCTIYTKHKASPPAQPMLPQDIPNGLWQEIAADYFHYKGKMYLFVCNLFSKYALLFKLNSKSALSLSQKLQNLYPSTDFPATSTLTTAPPLHPMSSCNFSSINALTIPHPLPTFPGPMASLSDKSKP